MASHETITEPARVAPDPALTTAPEAAAVLRRVSWGAVFAGVVVTIMTALTLNLLGFGIGVGTIDPLTEEKPFSGLGTGALIWMTASSLLSLFAGGFVAGRLAGLPNRADALLHGVVTWAFATLLSFFLVASTAGRILGGTVGVIGDAVGVAGEAATSPAARRAATQVRDRDSLIDFLATQGNMSRQQAAGLVDRWERVAGSLQIGREDAVRAGDKAAEAMSKGAIWAFFGLVLGGLACAAGAFLGTPPRGIGRWRRLPRDEERRGRFDRTATTPA